MAYSETTGLLEIDRNYRAEPGFSAIHVGRFVLLERLDGFIRKAFASGRSSSAEDELLARLSDRMLDDIGITRAEAIELDRRRHEAG